MQDKPNENNNKSENTNRDFTKDTNIFETTYEKVLSIINRVKDFIKKTSNTSKKLIEDLEWVIKVIANKSLYSYEVNKTKIIKQNEEYNNFINFVTKYNEEVLELNKRHILVSSIFSIIKKGEILLKPSLCLKKILPEELKNMDLQKEKEKRDKKRNSITQIGNIFLNMYYRGLEKQKLEKENQRKDEENEEKMNKQKKTEQVEIEKTDQNQNNNEIQKNNDDLINAPIIRKTNTIKNNINRVLINDFDKKKKKKKFKL